MCACLLLRPVGSEFFLIQLVFPMSLWGRRQETLTSKIPSRVLQMLELSQAMKASELTDLGFFPSPSRLFRLVDHAGTQDFTQIWIFLLFC